MFESLIIGIEFLHGLFEIVVSNNIIGWFIVAICFLFVIFISRTRLWEVTEQKTHLRK